MSTDSIIIYLKKIDWQYTMDKEKFDEQSKGTNYQQTRTIDADILEAET